MDINSGMTVNGAVEARNSAPINLKLRTVYRFECFDKDGNLKWTEEVPNLVTTEGKNDLLTQYFKGAAYTAAWFIGLVNNVGFTAYAAADTAAQIGGTNGWAEAVPYSNANRPTWTGGSASGGSIDDTGSPASFTINASATIRGAFLTSSNVKSGTAGKLYGEADFAASRSVINGDTLNVTVTLTVN